MAPNVVQGPSDAEELGRWTAVDEFFEGLLLPRDPVLEQVLVACRSAGLPDIQVTPLQAAMLQGLARICNARRALEIGTLGGYSAIHIARGLAEGGHLLTLELERSHAEVARANLRLAGLETVVEVRIGRASDSLRALAREGGAPFDFVFIDADKPSAPEYVELTVPMIRRGGLLLIDNVVRRGDVIVNDSSDPNVVGTREALRRISGDRRVQATVLQTVGRKGHDGMLCAVRTS